MAFSASKVSSGPFGNEKYATYSLDFDSVTTGTVETGFDQIRYAKFSNNTTTDENGKISKSGGTLTLTITTASDTGDLFVIGV